MQGPEAGRGFVSEAGKDIGHKHPTLGIPMVSCWLMCLELDKKTSKHQRKTFRNQLGLGIIDENQNPLLNVSV